MFYFYEYIYCTNISRRNIKSNINSNKINSRNSMSLIILLLSICIFTVLILFFYIINVTILSLYWNKYHCRFIKYNIIMKVKKKIRQEIQHTNKKKHIIQLFTKKATNM